MATINKITLPNGDSYDIEDKNAVNKAGDTMTGNLVVPAMRSANTYYGISFDRTTATPVETILYTGIKWIHGSHMPIIHVTGYAYGLQSPVEFKIGFYLYGTDICKIGWCGVTNMGAWAPEVYLFKYVRDNTQYVAVGFAGSCNFLQLQVDVQDEMGKFKNIVLDSEAWSWSFLTTAGTIPAADKGVNCIQVPYKANILNAGTVTNITAGSGLSIGTTAGGSLTTTGTINHTNSVTAQTTQAVYPIKIDAQGHISAYGSAQTILSLGTGSGNAFRGDYGNSAYAHAVTNKGSAFSSGLYKITTNSEGHVTAATAVAKSDITGLGIPGSDTTYTFDGTYNASTNKAATVSTVTNAINALDGTISGSAGAGKTLTAFSQTDGKVSATFGNISITKSQVSDFAHNHDDRYYTETESDAKYVTLSTAQTISGVKTFSAMPIAKAGVRVSNTGNTEGCDFVYDDTTQSVLMSFH